MLKKERKYIMIHSREEAEVAFEKIAEQIDELFQKETITPEEQKRIDLLFNNALVLEEIIDGETPWEFSKNH